MLHVVSFSTGLSSALTVERVLQQHGPEPTRVVFMNTQIEDQDNYRFMDDMERRWRAVYGLDGIEHIVEGRTPYRVFEDQNLIPNHRIAPCTHRLKIAPFVDYLGQLDGDITIHIGYDFAETHRIAATRNNYESRGWQVDFPLLWKPMETRPYTEVCRDDWGVEPPRTYAMGFSHANCLQSGCIKMGMGDWVRFLVHFPERYAETERWEQMMRDHPVRKDYAILRDRSNGDSRPMTLKELRERYEAEQNPAGQLALFNEGIVCIHCGVGDLVVEEE